MRKQAALTILAGIIPVCLCGCGNSKAPSAGDAASGLGGSVVEGTSRTAVGDGSAIGTGGSTAGASGGGTEAGSSTEIVVGGASAGSTGVGGTVSSLAGAPKTGGSVTASSGLGGTVPGGGSAVGGRTGGTGGVSITSGTASAGTVAGGNTSGGTTGSGGAKGTVVFPSKFVGNIDTLGKIRKDFTTYWEQFTPENAGKWMSVQGESGEKFNWSALDTLYATCEERNILFKEHTFVWGAVQPSWMGSLDATTGPAAVKKWMTTFCERYPKTRLIDVVNEPPPHTTPLYHKVIGGGNRTTWDWIANAFKWAREACPNAVLILNDYDNLEQDASVQNTIDIVTAIQKLDAPIDAIGCETHGADKLPASTLKSNIDKIVAATGLPVYITEYDISTSNDEQQKTQYQDHFPMFWDHASVKGVTVWGYFYGATYRSSSWLMNSDGTMRPAMTWLMDFLKR